jgi:GATA zinc finger
VNVELTALLIFCCCWSSFFFFFSFFFANRMESAEVDETTLRMARIQQYSGLILEYLGANRGKPSRSKEDDETLQFLAAKIRSLSLESDGGVAVPPVLRSIDDAVHAGDDSELLRLAQSAAFSSLLHLSSPPAPPQQQQIVQQQQQQQHNQQQQQERNYVYLGQQSFEPQFNVNNPFASGLPVVASAGDMPPYHDNPFAERRREAGLLEPEQELGSTRASGATTPPFGDLRLDLSSVKQEPADNDDRLCDDDDDDDAFERRAGIKSPRRDEEPPKGSQSARLWRKSKSKKSKKKKLRKKVKSKPRLRGIKSPRSEVDCCDDGDSSEDGDGDGRNENRCVDDANTGRGSNGRSKRQRLTSISASVSPANSPIHTRKRRSASFSAPFMGDDADTTAAAMNSVGFAGWAAPSMNDEEEEELARALRSFASSMPSSPSRSTPSLHRRCSSATQRQALGGEPPSPQQRRFVSPSALSPRGIGDLSDSDLSDSVSALLSSPRASAGDLAPFCSALGAASLSPPPSRSRDVATQTRSDVSLSAHQQQQQPVLFATPPPSANPALRLDLNRVHEFNQVYPPSPQTPFVDARPSSAPSRFVPNNGASFAQPFVQATMPFPNSFAVAPSMHHHHHHSQQQQQQAIASSSFASSSSSSVPAAAAAAALARNARRARNARSPRNANRAVAAAAAAAARLRQKQAKPRTTEFIITVPEDISPTSSPRSPFASPVTSPRRSEPINYQFIQENPTALAKQKQGYCRQCGVTESPEWRVGPEGRRTLCNACGLQYARIQRESMK